VDGLEGSPTITAIIRRHDESRKHAFLTAAATAGITPATTSADLRSSNSIASLRSWAASTRGRRKTRNSIYTTSDNEAGSLSFPPKQQQRPATRKRRHRFPIVSIAGSAAARLARRSGGEVGCRSSCCGCRVDWCGRVEERRSGEERVIVRLCQLSSPRPQDGFT